MAVVAGALLRVKSMQAATCAALNNNTSYTSPFLKSLDAEQHHPLIPFLTAHPLLANHQVKSVQAAARKALNNTTPEQAVHDKHHWMIVTVPERPAAGEELIIYFNRNTSETLRWVGGAVGWLESQGTRPAWATTRDFCVVAWEATID